MIGSIDQPIPRAAFNAAFDEKLSSSLQRFYKCTPTLVLLPKSPDEEDSCDATILEQDASSVTTVLKRKDGQEYAETLRKCNGKAILLNWCTASVEAYTKGLDDCAKIYDMDKVLSVPIHVDATNSSEVVEMLKQVLAQSAPMVPNTSVDYMFVYECMRHYALALGRPATWYVAFNTSETVVSAIKLTTDVMRDLFARLCDGQLYEPDKIYYRQETFAPTYAFAEGDWVVKDYDAKTTFAKRNKFGEHIVRTVHGDSFEATYRLQH